MTTLFERPIRTLLLVCLISVSGPVNAAAVAGVAPVTQLRDPDTGSAGQATPLPEAARRAQLDAITQARAGDYENALNQLMRLRSVYPDSEPLFYDELLVRFWAGQRQELIDMISGRSLENAPAYALLALGRAARDTRDFAAAINYYTQATAANPDSIDAHVGLAMAHSDAGDPRTARITLEAVPPTARHTTAVLMPSAYLFHQDQAYAQALGEYDLVLQLEPEDRSALRGKAQALRALLLPRQALRVAALQPDVLTPRELTRLEADVLALDLRDAIESPGQRFPFPGIESALQAIEARLAAEPPSSELARLLTYDRIVGLAAAHRRSEAVEDYQRLIEADPRAPRYVHSAAGNAYLALREPELAEQALRRGIEADPADLEIRISLFYALIELERFEEAFACIDDVVSRLEPIRAVPGSSVRQPNPAHTRALIVAIMGRAYADQMDTAEQQLENILAAAPNNSQARYELGNLYRWRGHLEAADEQYGQLINRFPAEEVALRTAVAHNRFAQRQFAVTGSTEAALYKEFPTDVGVIELHEDWQDHQLSQLIIDAGFGESSGDTFGSSQYEVEAWWFSPPQRDAFRGFVHSSDSWAEFEEGNHARRRIGAGVDYRRYRWEGRAEVRAARFDMGDPGIALRGDYRISDHWFVGSSAEWNSDATPLRADGQGIEGDLLALDTTYRHNENWFLAGSARLQSLDDGNDISGFGLNGSYRLHNGYRWKLDTYGSAGLTRSSLDEPSYFSPSRAVDASIGLRGIWRQFRRYEHSLTHRLSGDVGLYDQQGFGSEPIASIEYEIEWRPTARWGFRGGIRYSRRVYDGDSEDGLFFRFGLEGRI